MTHGISQEATALLLLRSAMTRLHESDSIWYDRDRYAAYALMARIASQMREDLRRRYA